MAKLKDIAEASGLSIPTVNQILNGYHSRFSISTCEKVMKAAEALSYRPNIAARSLRFNKSFMVGVLFFAANDKYVIDFMHSVQSVLLKYHYAPVFLTHTNEEEEATNLEICLERRMDGLIVNTVIDDAGVPFLFDKYKEIMDRDVPVMEVFGNFIPGVNHFEIDYYKYGYELTERLLKRGCKRIAFLTHSLMAESPETTKKFSNARGMHCGYCDVLKKYGITPHVFVHPLDSETDTEGCFYWGTMGIVDTIFDKDLNIDGIICMNEEQALALLNYASTKGIDLDEFIIASMQRRTNRILDKLPIEKIVWPIASIGTDASEAIMSAITKSKTVKS